MAEFKTILLEIKQTLRKILVFDIFIESLLVYLCLYLVFVVFNIPKVMALIPAVVYFIIMIVKRKDLTSIKTVEDKYPILNEALRTVSDTLEEDNYLVNHLRDEVKEKVKRVSASSFMDIKGDIFKIILSIGLVFLILSLSICRNTNDACAVVLEKTDVQQVVKNLDMLDIYDQFQKNKVKNLDLSGEGIDDNYNVQTTEMLLGDQSEINLGDNKVKIKIRLANDQIDIHDVSDDVRKKEFLDMDLGTIEGVNDVTFEEEISREHKEIVKNYFNTISK